NKGEIIFNNNSQNNCIYADILMGADTVRVYNLHYASIRLSPEDQIFTGNEKTSKSTAIKKDSKKILQRLKHAFITRARQAEIVADHMEECTYPIILCGDFNDTPISYAYHLMRGKLNDSFISSGSGLERTYAGLYPAFRIDYILYSDEFDVAGYHSIKEKWSDHYPIQSYLKLKK
ncbi:MAG: endonuclease/exonuclease/phosphatase family protein, partial [Bacteroidota bacterium]